MLQMRRASSHLLAGLTVALLAPAAAAQAPKITPKGDPSVRNDTIYSLAVKAEDHADESFVYLLDDGVVRYESDGRGTATYRQVIQILKEDASDNWAEQSFSYNPEREKLTVNWIRVVKPNGEVIAAKPAIEQESDVAASTVNPVYEKRKVLRYSLTGVAPGTLVDWSYTRERLQPYLPGDFSDSWSVTTGRTTRRSRYLLDLPASMTPHIRERAVRFPRVTKEANGRRTYLWATKELPLIRPEPFAADSNDIYASVSVSAPIEWSTIGSWYAKLARDRYVITPEIRAALDTVVARARTGDDSLRAIHRWVAQDIRYVSVALGIGGYQPRMPAAVFSTKYGDCKDKATMFVALARALGMTAYPVLLNSGGSVDSTMPGIEQFNHEIAAVKRADGKYLFLDLTSELTPVGALPYGEQGEFGLVVHDDGAVEPVRFPLDSIDHNAAELHLIGTLSPDGKFNGRYWERASGTRQYALRGPFSSPIDSVRRAEAQRALATGFFRGASGDSLVGFDGKDLQAEPRVSMIIRNGSASKRSGDTDLLSIPFGSLSGWAENMANTLDARGERHFPIDVADVIGPLTTFNEYRVTLPEGWKARVPRNVTVNGPFGLYESKYAQDGRDLVITRRLRGTTGILPKERISDLTDWLRQVSTDDVRMIVIDHPTTPAADSK
jgi:transglutaminase-like putative cysteine protease